MTGSDKYQVVVHIEANRGLGSVQCLLKLVESLLLKLSATRLTWISSPRSLLTIRRKRA